MIYRMAEHRDREKIINFINYVFSYDHNPHDFKKLIPKEYSDEVNGEAAHFLAVRDDGEIVGVVAVLPFSFCIGEYRLNCGYLGSVSVHPYARGEGHMNKLMEMARSWMLEQQISLALLSGLRQRYEFYGYSRGGIMLSYEINKDNVRHGLRAVDTAHYTIQQITEADETFIGQLSQLQHAQLIRAQREPGEFLRICRSWNQELYAFFKEDECVGYMIASGTKDIKEIVLKDYEDVKAMIKIWMAMCGKEMIQIDVRAWELALIGQLNRCAENVSWNSCENVQILDWGKVLPAMLCLKILSGQQLDDGCMECIIDDCKVQLSIQNSEIVCNTCQAEAEMYLNTKTYHAKKIQEKLFSADLFMHPLSIGGAPENWFPIPLALYSSDLF